MLLDLWTGTRRNFVSNRINFLLYKDTLIEEHILGIPGDVFIEKHLDQCSASRKSSNCQRICEI